MHKNDLNVHSITHECMGELAHFDTQISIWTQNTQKAVYTLCKALPKSYMDKNSHLSLSLSREREGVHPSALELHVHVQQNHYKWRGNGRTWLRRHFHVHVTPIPGHATWRQMHRWPSRHHVYHTMPRLNFKGEKEGMAGSWSKLVSTEISPRPTLIIWLSDVLLAAFENIVSETIQSWLTKNQPLHTYITSLHIHPEGALKKEEKRDIA